MKTRATFIKVLLSHLLLAGLIFVHLAGVIVISAASNHGSIEWPWRSLLIDGLVFIAIVPCWVMYRQERIAIVKWLTIALFIIVLSQIVMDVLIMF